MNKAETATLLGLAAATDRRTVGDADVESWHAVLTNALGEGLSFEDARKGLVEHYGTSREYLMPIHVAEYVRLLRTARRLMIKPTPPAELVDDHGAPLPETYQAYRQWRDEVMPLVESGRYQPDPAPDVVRRTLRELARVDPDVPLEQQMRGSWPAPVQDSPELEPGDG